MLFYIVDDDQAVRTMLSDIIEDEDLGYVMGEADNGSLIDGEILNLKKIDIVLIDLLMPVLNGIETIKKVKPAFEGRFIMISQVESKELIAEAYNAGVEYFIRKPINYLEVKYVIQKVVERVKIDQFLINVHKSLSTLNKLEALSLNGSHALKEESLAGTARFLLSELGVIGEKGLKDLMEMLNCLHTFEKEHGKLPPLKDLYQILALNKLGNSSSPSEINRETKAIQQRIRRTIEQSLIHLASIGMMDFYNPSFVNYASKYFDLHIVMEKISELKKGSKSSANPIRVNIKKFILVLYDEAKQLINR